MKVSSYLDIQLDDVEQLPSEIIFDTSWLISYDDQSEVLIERKKVFQEDSLNSMSEI